MSLLRIDKSWNKRSTAGSYALIYKEVHLEHGYRIDLLVENCVVLEIKMVEAIADAYWHRL
ncbi:MAG TPA: GxxExxY protein [Chitinophagaceae bacterium]|nr:GxxExxY protein [Chitinophagaceae bacterium]